MKLFFYSFLGIIIANSLITPVYALTKISPTESTAPSATLSPTKSSDAGIDQQISKLKDQIASRVAQLKLVEKRGLVGVVTEVEGTTKLTLSDIKGEKRDIDIDELTKFSNPGAKGTFGISDIQKGTFIGVVGLYNKESKHILARFIDVVKLPRVLLGVLTTIDKQNYSIHIATIEAKDVLIDHENFTKDYTYTKDDGLTKISFSKLVEGQKVLVIGFPDSKNPEKIIASRIILYPELKVNPNITLPSVSPLTSSTPAPSAKISH